LTVVSASSAFDSSGNKSITATCPAGWLLVGGGGSISGGDLNVVLRQSFPSASATWTAGAAETDPTGGNWSVTAYAVCAELA
jgi:hypothetical protein